MRRLLLLTVIVLVAAATLALVLRRLQRNASEPDTGIPAQLPTMGWLVFLLPLPVAAAAVVSMARGQLFPLLGDAIGYGLFLGGAILLQRGLLSSRPAVGERWPFKTLGSALISVATGITAWLGVGHHPAIALAFALVALLGCYLTYGFDLNRIRPFRDARGIGAETHATLAQAELSLAAIEQASRAIRQSELSSRLRRIVGLASEILGQLQQDPRNLRRARKFLIVYLDGVQRIVEGYAKTHSRVSAPDLEERFRRVLMTVEDTFREQQQKLLKSDLDDLDVQIEVLTKQLRHEGII